MAIKPSFSPRLVIIEGIEKGKVIELENGTVVIGRSKGQVLISDPRISRSHVAIHFDTKSGSLTFTDLKSLNGTLINNELKETGNLIDGDKLKIGNTIFDCQIAPLVQEQIDTEEKPGSRRKKRSISKLSEATHTELSLMDEDLPEEQSSGIRDRKKSAGEVTQVFYLKKLYLSLPRKTRIYTLCISALLLVLFYEFGGSGKSKNVAIRDIASVRRLAREGKLDEAITLAEQILKLDVKNAETYLILGDLYAAREKVDDAIRSYKDALKIDPNIGIAYVKLARVYLDHNRIEEAEIVNQEIDRLIKEGLEDKEFFIGVANLYLEYRELETPPQKMVVIGQALQNKIAPGELIGMKLEAWGLISQNFAEQASVILDRAYELFPKDQTLFQYRVMARLKLKDALGAAKIIEEWSKVFPDELRPYYVLAQIQFESQQYSEAMATLEKLVQLSVKRPSDPILPDSLRLLGVLYSKSNQPQEALTTLKHACELGSVASCDLLKTGEPASEEPQPSTEKPEPSKESPKPSTENQQPSKEKPQAIETPVPTVPSQKPPSAPQQPSIKKKGSPTEKRKQQQKPTPAKKSSRPFR